MNIEISEEELRILVKELHARADWQAASKFYFHAANYQKRAAELEALLPVTPDTNR